MSGLPTPAYRTPILLALSDMPNRRGLRRDVLNAVREILIRAGRFNPVDDEFVEADGKIRWEHRADSMRHTMVHKEGLLKDDSPRNLWELAEGVHVCRMDAATYHRLTGGKSDRGQEVPSEEEEPGTIQEQRVADLERRVDALEAALRGVQAALRGDDQR